MKVSDAVKSRMSIRSFKDHPVKSSLLRDLLQQASRSASGGNLQPWKIYVLNEASMTNFLNFQEGWSEPETPAYDIYPSKLKEPYRTSRFQLLTSLLTSLLNPRNSQLLPAAAATVAAAAGC